MVGVEPDVHSSDSWDVFNGTLSRKVQLTRNKFNTGHLNGSSYDSFLGSPVLRSEHYMKI
jgi:hypothetical protein